MNLPEYALQIKSENGKNYVFDQIRKKYVVLTPEEWVRQQLIQQLIELGYPASLMSVERRLPQDKKRYDLLVFNRLGAPLVLVECKAPKVEISDRTIQQLFSYLIKQSAPYCLLTNGHQQYFFGRNEEGVVKYQQIPPFATISG